MSCVCVVNDGDDDDGVSCGVCDDDVGVGDVGIVLE